MAAPNVTVARSRWPYAVLVVAVVAGAFWWYRDDVGAGASGRDRGAAARSRGGSGLTPFEAAKRRMARRRGLGPIAVAPPAAGLVRVQGTILDASSGKPVSDVEVVFADGASEASATSDLAGRYSIDVPAGRYRPFVRAEGILSVGRTPHDRLPGRPRVDEIAASRLSVAPMLAVERDVSGVDLEVVRSGLVRGRVHDRSGKPVAGAVVRAFGQQPRTPRPVLGTDLAETGLDGTFQLELAAAAYVLDAYHDGYGALEMTPSIELEAGEKEEVELTMIAGCVITGRVTRGGEPAGDGALERAWSPDSGDSFFPAGEFDAEGNFRWTTAEVGDVVLRAWPWKATHSDPRRFACTDGARFSNVVFEIPRVDPDLSGRIVTASGAPAAFAFLDITGLSPGTMNQQERADGEGRWGVFALPPGEYEVTAHVDGEGATSARFVSPASGLTMTLGGTGALAGKVDGVTDGSFLLQIEECRHAGRSVPGQARHLVTVRGGSYRVDGLPACDLVVEAGTAVRRRRLGVSIEAGQVATLDLDLRPPQSKTVHGTVRNADGRTVQAQVTVMRPAAGGMEPVDAVLAEDDGKFTVTVQGGDVLMVSGDEGMEQIAIGDDDPDPRTVDVTFERDDDHW